MNFKSERGDIEDIGCLILIILVLFGGSIGAWVSHQMSASRQERVCIALIERGGDLPDVCERFLEPIEE